MTYFHKDRSLFIVLTVMCLILAGCAEADNDSITRKDVEEFLADSAYDDTAVISDGAGSLVGALDEGADEVAGAGKDFADVNDGNILGGADAEDGYAGDDVPTQEHEDYIGGLSLEEYEALSVEEQDAIRDRLRKEVTPDYEDMILPEYRELYDYNNAVIGYIYIDGTVIDAPVLQTLADYEYYLHRDIDGRESEPGCIILDADSEIGIGTGKMGYLDGYEPSTIQLVHGHNMRNGMMFGSLLKYADEGYADRHAIIQYDSLYEHRTYEVICAFYSEIYPKDSDEFKYYTYNQLDTEDEYEHWIENIDNMSLYVRDIDTEYGDEYIVLSTCAYQTENGRFAVVGVRTE